MVPRITTFSKDLMQKKREHEGLDESNTRVFLNLDNQLDNRNQLPTALFFVHRLWTSPLLLFFGYCNITLSHCFLHPFPFSEQRSPLISVRNCIPNHHSFHRSSHLIANSCVSLWYMQVHYYNVIRDHYGRNCEENWANQSCLDKLTE